MGKTIHIISPRKEAEEMQEKYFAEHPQFYLSKHFCPIHAWKSCQKKHSEDVIVRAKLANKRARQIKLIEVEKSVPDPDEDFEAHMAAIEAEEEETAKGWDSWLDSLIPEETTAITGSKVGKSFRACKHHLQPFTFKVDKQEYTLFGSAYSDRKSEAQSEKADLCVFLDHRWMTEYSPVWMNAQFLPSMQHPNPATKIGHPKETPTMFLDWPDMGVLDIEDLKPVVKTLAYHLLHDNFKVQQRIEIGCMGGHGRTGTLMALIMVQLGCKPGKAIKTIRKDYCDKAIETKKQEELIKAFAAEVQGD